VPAVGLLVLKAASTINSVESKLLPKPAKAPP